MPPGGAAGAEGHFWLLVEFRGGAHELRLPRQSLAHLSAARPDNQSKAPSDWTAGM